MRKVLFLLSQLEESDLDWLMDSGEKRVIGPGEILIEKGKPIDALHIVLDGTFEVSDIELKYKPIQLGCGEVLGEVSLLDSRPPMATVAAVSDGVVLSVPRDALADKLDNDDAFSSRFYRALAALLAHRLRKTVQSLGLDDNQPLDEETEYEDELSEEMLDAVHLAGSRFQRALQRKLSE